jgi:AGCS family alanine or glycine:cation symporter
MEILESINSYVWGLPTLVLILGVGLFLSIFTGFAQLSLFPNAFQSFLAKFRRGKCFGKSVSAYQALCTALAATVGTGNIAGVAGAISIGGPGAVFWMWFSAGIGMATKYAEATLSVRYRVAGKDGGFHGGPMYMIRDGMGKRWKPLALCYCFCGVVAAFGVGNATQVNTLVGGMHAAFRAVGVPITRTSDILIGVAVAAMVGVVVYLIMKTNKELAAEYSLKKSA